MKTVIVRYKVHPGRAEENAALVGRVFEQLERERPPGLRYASYRLEDGVSFVHVASYEDTGQATSPLQGLSAFQEFARGLRERCEEPAAPTKATTIGRYHGA
jgi:hypothetical protein